MTLYSIWWASRNKLNLDTKRVWLFSTIYANSARTPVSLFVSLWCDSLVSFDGLAGKQQTQPRLLFLAGCERKNDDEAGKESRKSYCKKCDRGRSWKKKAIKPDKGTMEKDKCRNGTIASKEDDWYQFNNPACHYMNVLMPPAEKKKKKIHKPLPCQGKVLRNDLI